MVSNSGLVYFYIKEAIHDNRNKKWLKHKRSEVYHGIVPGNREATGQTYML